MHSLRTWSHRHLLIGALALALLFMQGLGLAHAVFHAGLASPAVATASADKPDVDDGASLEGRLFDAHHSCASFNALTLAFTLALSGLAVLLLARSSAPRQAPRTLRRVAARHRLFLSRAPPLLIV
jgi:hypothetical protein